VFELIQSGGLLMYPILFCSVVAMGIVGERFWTLRKKKILPQDLVSQVWNLAKAKKLDVITLNHLRDSSKRQFSTRHYFSDGPNESKPGA